MVWHACMQYPARYGIVEATTKLDGHGIDWDHLRNEVLPDINMAQYATLTRFVFEQYHKTKRRSDAGFSYIVKTGDREGEYKTKAFTKAFRKEEKLGFIPTMVGYSWHLKPDSYGMFTSFIDRYHKFCSLLFQNALRLEEGNLWGVNCAPLDIVFVWRTHQLNPVHYQNFSRHYVYNAEVADGATKIWNNKLMEEKFVAKFNQPYAMCLCWFCLSGPRCPLPDQKTRDDPLAHPTKEMCDVSDDLRKLYDREKGERLLLAHRHCQSCGFHPAQCPDQCPPWKRKGKVEDHGTHGACTCVPFRREEAGTNKGEESQLEAAKEKKRKSKSKGKGKELAQGTGDEEQPQQDDGEANRPGQRSGKGKEPDRGTGEGSRTKQEDKEKQPDKEGEGTKAPETVEKKKKFKKRKPRVKG